MSRNKYMVGLILLVFFVISFLTNIIGPLVPDIIRDFNLSLTMVAILPFAFFIAYGVMSIPAGMLGEKFGEKKIMLAAFIVSFVGSLMLAMRPGYSTAIVSLFLIGCGMAMLQVVMNPVLRTSGGEEHYAFWSIMAQLVFGLASFISPWVYSDIVTGMKQKGGGSGIAGLLKGHVPDGMLWISMYWIFAAICLVMVLVIFLSKFPKVELGDDEKPGALSIHLMLFRKRVVILYFIGILCYVGTEQGVANWISQFLSTYHGKDPATTGAQNVAYFWLLMTAGGLLGLVLVKLMDSRKVLVIFSVLAMLCLAAALFGSSQMALLGFPMVGFFASVMYPIIFSLALNSIEDHHGSFSGILVTGIVGGALAPLIVGWLGDMLGLRIGMCFLFLTIGFILSVGIWAKPLINNKTISLQKGEGKSKS